MGMGWMGVRFLEEWKERGWRLPELLYADDLVLSSELEKDLKVMMGHFVEVWRKRCLKVNGDKSKVMALGLEHVSEFKYLGCVLDESGTDDTECCE